MTKTLLITGATGKQGSEVIRAIFDLPQASDYDVFGLSRDISSQACQDLSAKFPKLNLVQGDLHDCEAALEAVGGPIWGVFSVQTPMGGGQTIATEEAYGKGLVDAAIARGVKHFIYTSVERNGDVPTEVPHFVSKHNIELYLKENAGDMSWTILRPTSFMDNSVGVAFFNKIVGAIWLKNLGMDYKRQFIACRDIGIFAAKSFSQNDNPFYHNRAIGLAGDSLSFRTADAEMHSVLGRGLPVTYSIFAWAIEKTTGGATICKMYQFFRDVGFHVDSAALRKEHPALLTFRAFLELEKSSRA